MYLLDSDVLINAKNAHYAFDLVPGFWRWLEAAHLDGRVYTVEKVVDEVMGRGDELSAWMGRQPDTFKLKPTAAQAGSFQQVSTWASQAKAWPMCSWTLPTTTSSPRLWLLATPW